ncbi:hypothetical protein O181_073404 [Austropuccinia psidii MF-1]|uniref:Uncharacterized protein n=1 Tax=Austropuccinia psidii MF-1 TaxID=1389203 RepID=A0A9Q3F712_9BASI|nr:hypothetical protein [Austropuccinia psidii MF-1]
MAVCSSLGAGHGSVLSHPAIHRYPLSSPDLEPRSRLLAPSPKSNPSKPSSSTPEGVRPPSSVGSGKSSFEGHTHLQEKEEPNKPEKPTQAVPGKPHTSTLPNTAHNRIKTGSSSKPKTPKSKRYHNHNSPNKRPNKRPKAGQNTIKKVIEVKSKESQAITMVPPNPRMPPILFPPPSSAEYHHRIKRPIRSKFLTTNNNPHLSSRNNYNKKLSRHLRRERRNALKPNDLFARVAIDQAVQALNEIFPESDGQCPKVLQPQSSLSEDSPENFLSNPEPRLGKQGSGPKISFDPKEPKIPSSSTFNNPSQLLNQSQIKTKKNHSKSKKEGPTYQFTIQVATYLPNPYQPNNQPKGASDLGTDSLKKSAKDQKNKGKLSSSSSSSSLSRVLAHYNMLNKHKSSFDFDIEENRKFKPKFETSSPSNSSTSSFNENFKTFDELPSTFPPRDWDLPISSQEQNNLKFYSEQNLIEEDNDNNNNSSSSHDYQNPDSDQDES